MQWLRDEGKIVLRDWWSLDTSRKTIKRSLEIWCCWGSRGKDLLFLLYPHWKFSLLRVHHEEVKQADLKFYPIIIISNPRKFTTGFLAFLRPVSQHHQIEIILSWCCWRILNPDKTWSLGIRTWEATCKSAFTIWIFGIRRWLLQDKLELKHYSTQNVTELWRTVE